MKNIILHLWVISTLLFMACGRNNNVQNIFENLCNAKITIPFNKMEIVSDRIDSLNHSTLNDYFMLIYIDSLQCGSCAYNHLSDWIPTINRFKQISNNISFIFIFQPSVNNKRDLFNAISERPKFNHADVYVDTIGVFIKANPSIPDDFRMHTFLLDKDYDVMAIGDPMHNKKVYNIMTDKIRETKKH